MNRPAVTKLLSVLLHLLVGGAVAAGLLARQSWFGEGDLPAFFFWTVPLAAGLAASGGGVAGAAPGVQGGRRLLLIGGAAALWAVGWFYGAALALGGWMGAFSFPVLYPWLAGSVAQLWFLDGRRARRAAAAAGAGRAARRLLWFPVAALGALLGLLAITALHLYLTRPQPETYLIPAGFEGRFRVVYGEPGGLQPAVEDGRRVLPVPADGILIIQPAQQAGLIDHQYYLLDAAGARRKLASLPDYAQRAAYAPGVLWQGSGGMSGAIPDGGLSSDSPLAIHYSEFLMVNQDTTTPSEEAGFRQRQRFDSLTEARVAECRRRAGAR